MFISPKMSKRKRIEKEWFELQAFGIVNYISLTLN
jgi:hypothetical protein